MRINFLIKFPFRIALTRCKSGSLEEVDVYSISSRRRDLRSLGRWGSLCANRPVERDGPLRAVFVVVACPFNYVGVTVLATG